MGMAMKDVRENLSDLVKRAKYNGERITFGPNRGDDVTLVATELMHRLESRLREAEEQLTAMRRREAGTGAFAGLQEALDAGTLKVRSEGHRSRRVLPALATESPFSRDERIRMGAQDGRAPEFRRSRSRA